MSSSYDRLTIVRHSRQGHIPLIATSFKFKITFQLTGFWHMVVLSFLSAIVQFCIYVKTSTKVYIFISKPLSSNKFIK